jgi:hypothetical protein
LFGDELPAEDWMNFSRAWAANGSIQLMHALGGLARRTPELRAVAPGASWFDIHAGK